MIGLLVPIFLRLGVVERVARVLAWIALAVGVALLMWALVAIYDRYVIDRHEAEREVAAAPAHSQSAAERLSDKLADTMADKARLEAIEKAADVEKAKPPEERAKLPPTTRALNCQLLRENYTPAELAKSDAYKINCKG